MNFSNKNQNPTKIIMIITVPIIIIVCCMWGFPKWNVWRAGMAGEAALKQAQQTRQIMVTQAQAELDSSTLRARAIGIVGQATKDFPEYRQQEFIGAFAEALKEGNIEQIIYVPTEANIPIIETGRMMKEKDHTFTK